MTDNKTCDKCRFKNGIMSRVSGDEPSVYCEFWHLRVCSYGNCDEFRGDDNDG